MPVEQSERKTWRHIAIAMVVVMVLVVLMDIIQYKLDDRFQEQQVAVAMTPFEQCQIWNKFSLDGDTGSCPGDLQPRWYRR
jgi:hypothetical protein